MCNHIFIKIFSALPFFLLQFDLMSSYTYDRFAYYGSLQFVKNPIWFEFYDQIQKIV